MSDGEILKAALFYADRGWSVIALHSIRDGACTCGNAHCDSPGKHPRTRRGLTDGTTEPSRIKRWWGQWPDANVAICSGKAAGIVVIDVDPRHGGDETLAELTAQHGELPRTIEAITGGGGRHLILEHPGSTVRNSSGRLGSEPTPGIDVRADGGYIVAPPSNHVSGGVYRWRADHGPGDLNPALMPPWLVELISNSDATPCQVGHACTDAALTGHALLLQRADQYVAKAPGVAEGERNERAFSLAGHLAAFEVDGVGLRLTEDEILGAVRAWNRRNTLPLDKHELRKAVQSAMKNGAPREPKIIKFQPGAGTELGNDTPDDPRPIVLLPGNGIEDRQTAVRLGRLLAGTGQFYNRGGILVSLSRDDDGAPVLMPVKTAAAPTEFEEVARLQKINNKGVEVHAICHTATAERITSARVFREALPAIHVISPVPVLIERNGELVQIFAYDRESGVLAQGPPASDMTVNEAKLLLEELIADFDFVTISDRSRALAAFLVPALVMGALLDGRAPLDLGEADQSQAGKGFRAKLVAAVYGRRVATVTQRSGGVGSIEESFSAHLIAGRTFISFDNLRGKLDIPAVESFMTEDSYIARVPYGSNVLIDPRRFIVSMTSNRAELTPDMANRASIVRISKRLAGYAFRQYPEGYLLAHVRANNRRYLGAVFAVVRAWYEAEKPRSNETGHDFRAWAQTLDWIVRELLGAAPLLEGHQAAKTRIVTPHLTWLRDLVLEVAKNERLDEPLRTHNLLDLLAAAAIEIPGVESGSNLDDEATRGKALRGLGRRLGLCFGHGTVVVVDRIRIQRAKITDLDDRQTKEYTFTEQSAPSDPQDDPLSLLPVSVSPTKSPHGSQTFCARAGEGAAATNPNAFSESSESMGGLGGNEGNGQKTCAEGSAPTWGTSQEATAALESAAGSREDAGTDPGGPDGERATGEIRDADTPDDDNTWVEI